MPSSPDEEAVPGVGAVAASRDAGFDADPRTLRLLEYHEILEDASRYAFTVVGGEAVRGLGPLGAPDAVADASAKTAEALRLLARARRFFAGVSDIRVSLRRAERGGVLTAEELEAVGETVAGLAAGRDAFDRWREEAPRLAALAAAIEPQPRLAAAIGKAVRDGAVVDAASPLLEDLRRRIREAEAQVRETLDGLVRDRGLGRYLQEPLVTQRKGRFVLPVKAEFRHQVPGIVHDVSASGQTVFVEPKPVVELGNRREALVADEEREVARILRHLSRLVGQAAPALARALALVAEIDAHLARALWGEAHEAVLPEVGAEELVLRRARHPLLGPRAVPLDLTLSADQRVLVITGPNTGGKTIALKTVALFALLAQSGFPLPAEAGTRLPLFDGVYADIGDEQSIAQNLSTFSSHIGAIAGILRRATQASLVVLDELGAGTDPEEGSALARAIVEELLHRGTRTVVTTHFAELKTLAEGVPGVENASMLFDAATLTPTYRLVQGQAGASHALEIALRLGIPSAVVERAKGHLGAERVELREVLVHLHERQAALEAERRRLAAAAADLEERERRLAARDKAAEAAREQELRRAREEARSLVARAKRELAEILREARAKAAAADAEATLREVRAAVRRWDEATAEPLARASGPDDGPLAVGDWVEVLGLGQYGRVVAMRGEQLLVEVGMVRMALRRHEVRRRGEGPPPREAGRGAPGAFEKRQAVRPEVDLRGLTSEDALAVLEKYLDDALLAGLGEVRIIHGKGTGALRRSVAEYLRRHPRVERFRLGGLGEGDDGVTVATLR